MVMKDTIARMKECGIYDKVKVMIGGAPITPEFAKEIGAYYSANASETVDLTKKTYFNAVNH